MDINKAKYVFRRSRIKFSQQRLQIFLLLNTKNEPISADDIYLELIKGESNNINISTVYRILGLFTKKGLVLKSNLNIDGKATFEINHRDHRHHLICIQCGKIVPISGCPLKEYERSLIKKTNYLILEHNLEIRGICPECQKIRESKDIGI